MKPSRSDEIPSAEEEQRRAKQIQELFASLAPKRPLKPSRSEPSDEASLPPNSHSDLPIPEYTKFLKLEAKSQPLITAGGIVEDDTYVENEYYKDLLAVQEGEHHTTGTGFIDISDVTTATVYKLFEDSESVKTLRPPTIQCNPATNDWIPSPPSSFVSSNKPRRSDP